MGSEVDSGKKPKETAGIDAQRQCGYCKESGQRSPIVLQSGVFCEVILGLDHPCNASGFICISGRT